MACPFDTGNRRRLRKKTVDACHQSAGHDSNVPQTVGNVTVLNTRRISIVKNSMKAIMLSAAVSGLLSGSTVSLYAAGRSASISSQNLGQVASAAGLNQADKDKHSCKGKNECKGTGGCKSGDNGCKAKNSCKGKGGCATDGS